VRSDIDQVEERRYRWGKRQWDKLSPRTQNLLDVAYAFFNSTLIGATFGAIIGLVPPLHRAFSNNTEEGGFLNAWLTSSLSNIGQLFVSLQVVVVGVPLGAALRKMKCGEAFSSIPWIPSLFMLVVRFMIWLVISISVTWTIATKTSLLGDDPIFWFTMMLMPTWPTAVKLVTMADCNNADEEKTSISKFLVV
jgi:predicted permease